MTEQQGLDRANDENTMAVQMESGYPIAILQSCQQASIRMGTNSDDNFDIDRAAVHYVEGVLTGRFWELSKLDPDRVGIDRRCVLRGENRQPTHSFYIQIKGRGVQKHKGKVVPLVSKGGFISQDIEIEHLDYYMSLSVPVFLVVVDVTKRIGYWLFAQRYIRDRLGDRDWRLPLRRYRAGEIKQKPSISVRIPATNKLENTEGLKAAVERADGYMASLTINRGIEYEADELHNLDPRFDINLTISSKGSRRFHINAKNDVTITLKGTLPKEKHEDLWGRGLPVPIIPGEVEVEGSPLWEKITELVAEKRGMIQFSQKWKGAINLILCDTEGRETGRLSNINCKFEGGPLQLRLKAETPFRLLSVKCCIHLREREGHSMTLQYHLEGWYKQPVLNLPFLEPMRKCLTGLIPSDNMRLEILNPGSDPIAVNAKAKSGTFFTDLALLTETLGKAQEIAAIFGINPRTTDHFSRDTLQEINELYDLVKGRRTLDPDSFKSVTITVAREGFESILKLYRWKDEPGELAAYSDAEYDFFGATVRVNRVKHEFSHMILSSDPDEVRKAIESGAEEVEIVFSATEKTEHFVTGPEGGYTSPSLDQDSPEKMLPGPEV